ncbi:MAG: hypothetical protein PHW10_04915 [Candidatus Peribacteraceae bacterium]|nr:hypothetical protein [Candidatus Peribacteraceae bacterium]
MQKTCKQCATAFDVTDDDLAFLDKLSPVIAGKKEPIPPPTLCPECRQQRRVSYVNHVNLYKRTCDQTGEPIVAIFPPESPFRVFRQEAWFSDAWDPLAYGRPFDFSRPFFEQFRELMDVCPWPALFTAYNLDENCEYTNNAGRNKNCYMIFDSDENRDCYFSYSVNGSENCAECFRVRKSELCVGCIDSLHCYHSAFLQDCENCSDSMFLKSCIGCKHCLMSSNLRNKEYMVENKQVGKAAFDKIMALMGSASRLAAAQARFEQLKLEYPQKAIHGTQNENVSGDYITQSKNAFRCFDCTELWDCRHCFQGFLPLRTCMDTQECGEGELLYECSVCGYGANGLLATTFVLENVSSTYYCMHCRSAQNAFGCFGLRHQKYCILNKRYAKDEYEALVPKIIAHMRKTGEWGEFFPMRMSYAAYNETLAQDYYPLTKDEALKQGLTWRDTDERQRNAPTFALPDDIKETPDTVTKELLCCESCKKNYRILPQILRLYRQMGVPLPCRCYACTLESQHRLRNPRKLWNRTCMKCAKDIQTTYPPSRPDIVYCEQCYLEEVY